jgi:glycosyltransferase involved in cell wall biosynthesis
MNKVARNAIFDIRATVSKKKRSLTGRSEAKTPQEATMKNNPLISIVVCTHNRADLIGQTMETIFAQEYKPVEILVVDDGSTDNTLELMKGYGDRIRYYRQENKGIAATRTAACKLALGEYIAFQDDDDLMTPDRITCLYGALCRYPKAIFSMGDWEYMDQAGNFTGKKHQVNIPVDRQDPTMIEDAYSAVLWPLLSPVPHTTLFRKSDGERIGWFDDVRFFRGCSDTDFYARLGQLGPIVYVPKVVSYYRVGHAQIWDNKILGAYSFFLLIEKHLECVRGEQSKLRKRLEERMLATLLQIEFLVSAGARVPDSVSQDYLERGLSFLDSKGRLRYKWYTSGRLPLRNLMKGEG